MSNERASRDLGKSSLNNNSRGKIRRINLFLSLRKVLVIAVFSVILLSGLFAPRITEPSSLQKTVPTLIANPPPSGSTFDYLVVILMENEGFNTINGNAVYLNQLAASYSLATRDTAVDHPSLPNYLALSAADTFGCGGYDGAPNSNGCTSTAWGSQNIVDRMESAGLTWKAYMENMPSNCYNLDSGNYAVRHDPFVYYNDVASNQARCNRIVPATASSDVELINDLGSTGTASNFMWLTPNLCNDMHDCSVSTGDTYLSGVVPKILSSTIFRTQKAALLITFDEGTGTSPSDLVYTVWAGPVVKRNYQSAVAYSHFSVLRTIESAWNLPALTTNDASATGMTEFFVSPQQSVLRASFNMSRNSVQTAQSITFTGTASGGTPPYSYNWNFGDGDTGTGPSIVHSYQSANTFNTTLTVTDTLGATSTFSQTVTVAAGGTCQPIVLYLAIGGISIGLLVLGIVGVKRRKPRTRNLNP